jgi:hypothetical protein
MYELIYFDNPAQSETYGRDAFGEFGTILATDVDLAIPEPDSQTWRVAEVLCLSPDGIEVDTDVV